ncbi:MAG: hypothetical protein QM736_05250 [Vicinamibacterales bacterium]
MSANSSVTRRRSSTADGSACPHDAQKFASAGLSTEQAGHTTGSTPPQRRQNGREFVFSAPQFGQCMRELAGAYCRTPAAETGE